MGQRVVVATAVQHQWPMACLDVSEAFLKGFTFEEIQDHRGGPRRRVSLILPRSRPGGPSGVSILRTIKGYEGFNEAGEVLEMLKRGFGLIDAPNLFTSRVDEILVAKGIKPTCSEPKIYLNMGASETNKVVAGGQCKTGGGLRFRGSSTGPNGFSTHGRFQSHRFSTISELAA